MPWRSTAASCKAVKAAVEDLDERSKAVRADNGRHRQRRINQRQQRSAIGKMLADASRRSARTV
jgi:hypothetical protein